MTFPHLSIRNYRAFIPAKLVRDGILLDVINRNGFAFAHRPNGNKGLLAHTCKMHEELIEAHKAYLNKSGLEEEIVDCIDAITLFTHLHPQETKLEGKMARHRRAMLPDLIEKLKYTQATLALTPSLSPRPVLGFVYPLTAQIHDYLNLLIESKPGTPITPESLEIARAAKEAEKGKYSGLYADAIILPRSDEWCPYFASKFPEVNPAYFNLDMAQTIDSLKAATR